MTSTEPATDRALAEIERHLAFVIRFGNLPRIRERLAERAGLALDPSAYVILLRVGEEDPPRLSDLAAALGVDLSTVSRQVKQLEQRGLVERVGHPSDGRASVLRLTRDGRRASERLRDARHEAIAELVREWTPDERAQFGELLGRLAESMIELSAR